MTAWYDEDRQRFSVRAYPYLVELIKNDGWEFTEWIHQALLSYNGLDDPHKKRNLEKLTATVMELKERHPSPSKCMSSSSGTGAHKNGSKDPELLKLRFEKLETLGSYIQAYPQCTALCRDLKRQEPDDILWDTFCIHLNNNGFEYEDWHTLWNDSLGWWKAYPQS
jgi:hypothetical protein